MLKEKKEMLKLEENQEEYNSYNLANMQHKKKQAMSIRLVIFIY